MNKTKLWNKIDSLEERVIHSHIKHELVLLYLARIFLNIFMTTLGVFLPIYFYKQYQSIYAPFAIFALIYLIHAVVSPLVARLLNVLGTTTMMVIGATIVSVSVLVLELGIGFVGVLIFIITSALYRSFYWVPYQVDLADWLDKKHKAGQLAFLRNTSTIITALTPLLTGYMAQKFGFLTLFVFVSLMVVFAILIMAFFVPNQKEKYSWGYLETFKHLFKNKYLVLSQMAFGAQSIGFVVIWPIFMYLIVSERLDIVGGLTTLVLIIILFLRMFMAKLFDSGSKEKALKLGIFFTSSGWFAKMFVNSPLDILFADIYHQVGRAANRLSLDSAVYEQSADAGNYIDEYTILKEISLNLGRVLMILISAGAIYLFGIRSAFMLAGIVSLFMFLISKNKGVR